MAMSLEISEKLVQTDHLHPKHGKKIVKIGPVYPEIIVRHKKLTQAKHRANL